MKHVVVHFQRKDWQNVIGDPGLYRFRFKHAFEGQNHALTIGPVVDEDVKFLENVFDGYRVVIVD